ncbi:hypothetical protein SLOPH_944 [Spraguea lophii 42_110]|uniref:Uncharacterized protein n=1 Tax=Spraguea lophii (strain 42_110) TaxID=1358809 RepID=S7XIW5_SPRLO|nr:hypothetical protein SLOPH_944 [Spraguea lophii 42_110]
MIILLLKIVYSAYSDDKKLLDINEQESEEYNTDLGLTTVNELIKNLVINQSSKEEIEKMKIRRYLRTRKHSMFGIRSTDEEFSRLVDEEDLESEKKVHFFDPLENSRVDEMTNRQPKRAKKNCGKSRGQGFMKKDEYELSLPPPISDRFVFEHSSQAEQEIYEPEKNPEIFFQRNLYSSEYTEQIIPPNKCVTDISSLESNIRTPTNEISIEEYIRNYELEFDISLSDKYYINLKGLNYEKMNIFQNILLNEEDTRNNSEFADIIDQIELLQRDIETDSQNNNYDKNIPVNDFLCVLINITNKKDILYKNIISFLKSSISYKAKINNSDTISMILEYKSTKSKIDGIIIKSFVELIFYESMKIYNELMKFLIFEEIKIAERENPINLKHERKVYKKVKIQYLNKMIIILEQGDSNEDISGKLMCEYKKLKFALKSL